MLREKNLWEKCHFHWKRWFYNSTKVIFYVFSRILGSIDKRILCVFKKDNFSFFISISFFRVLDPAWRFVHFGVQKTTNVFWHAFFWHATRQFLIIFTFSYFESWREKIGLLFLLFQNEDNYGVWKNGILHPIITNAFLMIKRSITGCFKKDQRALLQVAKNRTYFKDPTLR